MGLGLIASHFINDIETFCNLSKDTVLGIDDLAVEMDNPTEGSHFAAGFFKFGTDISYTCGLSGAGFTIDKNVRGGFVPK